MLRGLAEKPAKRDNRCQAGKVQEQKGRDALRVEAVLEVGQVVRRLALNVVDEAAEQAAGAHQAGGFTVPTVIVDNIIFMDLEKDKLLDFAVIENYTLHTLVFMFLPIIFLSK